MPPTVNPPGAIDKRRPGSERRTDVVCRVKYCNTLPDIPFDPKFITYPFESNRFIQYNATSLERSYRYELLAEHDLGVTIDLINPSTYVSDPNAKLDPADERLLEDEMHAPQDSKRSMRHAKNVSWLRRTEYISTEATRFQPMTIDKVEAKVGYSIKKTYKEDNLYLDHDSQIKAIEKTFQDAKRPIEKHHSKPGVVPVEIMSVFPDFKLWKYPCAQVIFDADPAPSGRSLPAQLEEMSQAMIRGVVDETGEQFVAYFLPTTETIEKRKRIREMANEEEFPEDEEYDYRMARQYNWNVKSKASKGYEENYFMVFRPEGVYYNELETRVRLTKRRPKAGAPALSSSRLVVKHRPVTAREHRAFRQREKNLEPPGNEEEEDMDDEEEEELDLDDEQRVKKEPRETKDDEEEKAESSSEEGRKSRSRSRSRSGSRSSSASSNASASSKASSASGSDKSRSQSPASAAGSKSRSASPSGSEAGSTNDKAEDKEGEAEDNRPSSSASQSNSSSSNASSSESDSD